MATKTKERDVSVRAQNLRSQHDELQRRVGAIPGEISRIEADVAQLEQEAMEAELNGKSRKAARLREEAAEKWAGVQDLRIELHRERRMLKDVDAELQEVVGEEKEAQQAMRAAHRAEVESLVTKLGKLLAEAHMINREIFQRCYEVQSTPVHMGWFDLSAIAGDPGKSGHCSNHSTPYTNWIRRVTDRGFEIEVPPRPNGN